MKKLVLLAASFSAFFTVAAHASELTIDIGNDAFHTEFVTTELSRNSQFAIAVLATDTDVNVYSAKALVSGNVENIKNLDAALGVKTYYLDLDTLDDEYGFGLGGEISYKLPMNPRAKLSGHYYYSPAITVSGSDVRYISDFSVQASYALLKNGEVHVGYHNLTAGILDSKDLEISAGLHLGVKFLF